MLANDGICICATGSSEDMDVRPLNGSAGRFQDVRLRKEGLLNGSSLQGPEALDSVIGVHHRLPSCLSTFAFSLDRQIQHVLKQSN